ncbi:hypothetical protein GYMLUDRAFT_92002 [Collybiopsis luxurians FD-317 M1]|nr:hypothetical protein GYMLUDRAFT_92002 [Collybiopsis luxurians FD-317 M1]
MESRSERKPPRRLFSFDSVKSSSTRRSSSDTSYYPESELKRTPKNSLTTNNADIGQGNVSNWTLPDISESPHSITPRPTTPYTEREKRRGPLPPVLVDTTVQSVTQKDGLPPPSPSSVRWNSIRQHVLPSSKSTHVQQTSSISLSSVSNQAAASRSGHGKQSSKFAQKLGFRNVVDQAKQVMVDEVHQFALDIQRACAAARHVELPGFYNIKSRIDPIHNTMGSSLSLPFMSSATLAPVGGGGNTPNQSRSDLRQPSTPSLSSAGRVRPLYQTLVNYASPFTDGNSPLPHLPNESLVLSTLLIPFLTTENTVATEEDRWLSIDAFQVIIKTWNPTTEIVAAERSLWCVQAALSSIPPMRSRLLSALWTITVPEATHYPASNPKVLQTLLHGLFLLLPLVSAPVMRGTDTEDSRVLSDIIAEVCTGSCGQLDNLHIEEEYNALFVDADSPQRIRDAVIIEALAKCLEYSADSTRRWLLANSLENLWSLPDEDTFTPLLTAIHSRALHSFTRASLALVSTPAHGAKLLRSDAALIVQALQTRVLPELRCITNNSADEAKGDVVLIALNVVASDAKELVDWSIATIAEWYRHMHDWKDSFEKNLKSLIMESPWLSILKILPPLMRLLPDDMRRPLVIIVLSALNNRLVDDPPPYPCLPLSSLLDTLSQTSPQIFYKPLFLCAASSREHVVVNHLCTLTAISRFMPDFWCRDAEMMSIAIMGDAGGLKSPVTPSKETSHSAKSWGIARLGQSILIVEVIAQIQNVRRSRESPNSIASDTVFGTTARFAIALEQRLSILIESKERTTSIPVIHRLLLCMLFREVRLLTRSLKNASWLPRFVEWFRKFHGNDHFDDDSDLVTLDAITQIKGLYELAQTGGRSSSNRRSTIVLSPTSNNDTFDDSDDKNLGLVAIFAKRTPILEALSQGFDARALKLMVAVSALIKADDLRRLGNILWEKHLEETDPKALSSICFLVMQCAEKNPHDLLARIEVDLRSLSDDTRLGAIRKMTILTNWRFQIMSQNVITDRAHRPFKVARGPLPFVTTDMGSGTFVLELDPNDVQDKLPLELRKKLAEIGWDDNDAPVNQQLEWIRTPVSNLPALQMERLDNSTAPPSPGVSPVSSPSKSPILSEKAEELNLLRRNSTSGGPLSGLKRRAIFVLTLAEVLPLISTMTLDRSFVIAYAARNVVFDLMRNDPGMLTRPVWDFFTGENSDLPTAVMTLRAFLHSRRALPPAMAHIMLNTLTGFLKLLAKQTEDENTLHYFAQLIPTIAKLVPQVYEMSIRELRRAKVDMFLVPSGSLWFPPSAPPGPMFPRGPGALDNPFEDIPSRIISVTIIRISQNMLFLAMLKRNPAEVQVVRKNMAKLVFPSLTGKGENTLELKDFVPSKESSTSDDDKLRGLSLMLSRSYILLVAQIFRCLSRHLNDRNELAVIIESLNRILLAHNDVGIVGQTLIAFLVASTRFRRLFASGGGYTLFMPVLFKVYAESEAHPGIRHAIEFAINRFYAYHEETFLFQSLDAISRILVIPDINQAWIVKNIYSLFASLNRNTLSSEPDIAGIHNANKTEERETLMLITAEEKPQTFFASVKAGNQSQNVTSQLTIELPAEYESKRLAMDDFIRLFLTVIAHDLTISRAEHFLKLFRYLVPSLYEASNPAPTVLRDGLEALGAILSRPILRNKPVGQDDVQSEQSSLRGVQLTDLSKVPSDIGSMRMDYLWSLVSFVQAGGKPTSESSRNAFLLAKVVLRDSPTPAMHSSVALFLGAFCKYSMIPQGGRSLKAIIHFLRDLVPIVSEYALAIDFTEVFDTIGELSRNPLYFNDATFCHLVVNQICAAGLRACDIASSQGSLHNLPMRRSLILLIANAVLLPGVDIFSVIEAHEPHYNFLALVVFPLALRMRTIADIDSNNVQLDITQQILQARAWPRLVLYVMACCRRIDTRSGESRAVPILDRSRSQDKRSSTAKYGSRLPSLLIALQIIKIILIRAGEDLNRSLPGIWSRLATFIREVIGEGNAQFTLRTQDPSPAPSPTPSPRASGQFNMSAFQPASSELHNIRSFMSPRMLDYCMWSFLELLCVYRNPLFTQLRAFTHEKVRVLDNELRFQRIPHTPLSSRSPRPSSVFTKRRRRVSNVSPSNSPEVSPRLTALATPDMSLSNNFSLYQNIPPPPPIPHLSSQESSFQDGSGPRIIHLGLTSNSFRRSLSPAGTSVARYMAKSIQVKSLVLIRKTYLRIRVVQSCMGYQSELLPLPRSSVDPSSETDDVPVITAWTQRRALQEVNSEIGELLAEFEESSNDLEDEGVMVDPGQDVVS